MKKSVCNETLQAYIVILQAYIAVNNTGRDERT